MNPKDPATPLFITRSAAGRRFFCLGRVPKWLHRSPPPLTPLVTFSRTWRRQVLGNEEECAEDCDGEGKGEGDERAREDERLREEGNPRAVCGPTRRQP